MKKLLLDTNAYVSLLAGDVSILDALAGAEHVFLSVVVLGELYAGFKGGTRERKNREILDGFMTKPTVSLLDITSETAEVFGEIKNVLRKAGTPLPINDVWIAAQAMETGAVLVTLDRHFSKIPGLRVWPSG